MQNPIAKSDLSLGDLAGKRVGVEGNWFVKVVRSHLKREDPFWALAGPVCDAIRLIVEKFLKRLGEHGITPVFVFDGLYTRRQAHPAVLLHNVNAATSDLKHQVREMEPLDEDAIAYLIRLLVSLNLEVVTAPYLAWAQLAYFAAPGAGEEPLISEVLGAVDVLCLGRVQRVISEIGNLDDQTSKLTAYSCNEPDKVLQYLLQPPKLKSSPHWSWLIHHNTEEDYQHVRLTITQCPVFCLSGQLKPVGKVFNDTPALGNLRQYFYNDLGASSPLIYFLLCCNVISPQLLNVVAAEQFIDDPPFIVSAQYRDTLERILPLRTQIVFQLVQDLERFLKGFERLRNLKWERPHEEQAQSLPIQRPPKIALDEWDGLEGTPEKPYNFISVLEYHNKACPVDESTPTPPVIKYGTSEQALGAVLLKALDLLGYFTHAAHTNETEESSMSIFAQALQEGKHFGNECVLLIELTRTRSLHDGSLDVMVADKYQPSPAPPGARYAARIMSLLRIPSGKMDDAHVCVSADLLAFNDIARAFQRSLRLLSEAIAATQVLNGSATYELAESRDMSARLPFATPLTIHAGLILEYMLNSKTYQEQHINSRRDHLSQVFPYVTNMRATLHHMKEFWASCTRVICKLLEDEEAEPEFYQSGSEILLAAHQLVVQAFNGIDQIPGLPEIKPPPPPQAN